MIEIQAQLEKIIDILKTQKQSISFAESCTGGGIASAFTAISGVSSVFGGSCVTYSNDIKKEWLGVKHETLLAHGAVSSACVEEMLEGIAKMAKSDCAIAVSGIAGPTGGTEEKPVGTVYIGIKIPKVKKVYACVFEGNRIDIQKQSIAFAIEKCLKMLKN